jgi:hypothetical protein
MTVAVCARCAHYRRRAPVRPFAASELTAPGVLKELATWEQEERQRAHQEYQAFMARQPFTYEPHNYAWCAKHSREADVREARAAAARGDPGPGERLLDAGAAVLDPVTGELSALYQLCSVMNAEGRCEEYVARTS